MLDRSETGRGEGGVGVLALALLASLALHASVLQALRAADVMSPTKTVPAPMALVVRLETSRSGGVAMHRSAFPEHSVAHTLRRAERAAQPMKKAIQRRVAQAAPERRPVHATSEIKRAVADAGVGASGDAAGRTARPGPGAPRKLAAHEAVHTKSGMFPALAVLRGNDVREVPRRSATESAPAVAPRSAASDLRVVLEQYRHAIMAQARRYAYYPQVARDNGWQGKSEVRMVVAADGKVAALELKHGSGYVVLDREALGMLRKAQPHAEIPDALRGRRFTVVISVIFRLREPSG